MLTVKKVLAGRGAVDYYLNQTRRGLGDYYLPDERSGDDGGVALSAPGSSWWGGGTRTLAVSGEVGRAEFGPLFATAAHPAGGHLGRAERGAGGLYNRTVEAELTRRLGVGWRDRPDGLRELAGVDDDLIEAFSSRRRAITATVERLAAAYRDKYGVDAPPAVRSAMAQNAWATTRQRKRELAPGEALERWEATARRHGRQLARLPAQVLGQSPQPPAGRTDPLEALVARLAASGRATFTRHDLLCAALDVLPPGGLSAVQLQAEAERLVARVVARPELVGVTAPDVIDAPVGFRRRDGSSVYEQPARRRPGRSWAGQVALPCHRAVAAMRTKVGSLWKDRSDSPRVASVGSTAQEDGMMPSGEQNKAIAQRAIDAANVQDRSRFDPCYADEVLVHTRDGDFVVDHDTHWQVMVSWFEAFPDLVESTQEMLAEGDTVFVRSRYSGTHEGPWRGIAATGRRIVWDFFQVLRFDDGVIVEDTFLMDELSILLQMGVLDMSSLHNEGN